MTEKDLKVFQSPRYAKLAQDHPDLQEIAKEFKKYKLSGAHADFGRDELYDEPEVVRLSGLRHVHIIPAAGWDVQPKKPFDKTSNRALVYCQSPCQKYCLLFAFMGDAHDRAWKTTFLAELSEEAEGFFKKLGLDPDIDHQPDE